MTVIIEAELPFEECNRCLSFDPVIDKSAVRYDEQGHRLVTDRKLTCKGYTFCKYLKENVLKGEHNG